MATSVSSVSSLCKQKLLSSHLKSEMFATVYKNCLALQILAQGLRDKAISRPSETTLIVRQALHKASKSIDSIIDYCLIHCPAMFGLFLSLKRIIELYCIDFGTNPKLQKQQNQMNQTEVLEKESSIKKIVTIEDFDLKRLVNDFSQKKSIKELILSHQMQVKAMFLKCRPKLALTKELNQENRRNRLMPIAKPSRFPISYGEVSEPMLCNRSDLLSRANSSLDLSGNLRNRSRERSRPNVSIFRRSGSNQKELSTIVRI